MKNIPIHFRVLLLVAAFVLPLLAVGQITPIPAGKQTVPVLITGATIHVGNGNLISGQDLLFADGKIQQIGANLQAPAGTVRIDAAGKHLYPGLIALNSILGLVEIEAVRSTDDISEVGDFNASARGIVGYNTDSHILPVVRSNGVLLAQVAPQGGIVSGRSSLVQLDAWNWEDAALRTDEGLHLNWPSSNVPWWAAGNPEAEKRAKEGAEEAFKGLYSFFDQAVAYRAQLEAGKLDHTDLGLAAAIPFLKGEGTVYIAAYDVAQLEGAVAFADKYKLKIAIKGGYDAWRVPSLLTSRNIPVIVMDVHALPQRADEDVDQAYKLPKLLADAGIRVAISLEGGWKQFNLPFHAGTAAAYGLGPEAALKAITMTPAEILGVADRMGTLEVGKDATLILSEGDVLDMRTSRVTEAFIQGRRIDLNNKQKDLYRKWQAKYQQAK